MADRTTRTVATGPPLWHSVAAAAWMTLVLVFVLWATLGVGPAGWAIGVTYAVAGVPLIYAVLRQYGSGPASAADRVTLTRAVLVGGVAVLVVDGAVGVVDVTFLVGLATLALLLDAVDGALARRTGSASERGARFDMEVDALLILVLSVHVAQVYGWWVLAIGGMRYVFAAAPARWPWLGGALPPSTARKAVAAAQGVALVVVSSTLLPGPVAVGVLAVALGGLTWSFARDVRGLWCGSRLALPPPPEPHGRESGVAGGNRTL